MRIFLSGNEEVAKWHLPVAQSKVAAFADECRKSGLKQNRFTFLFKESGATVEAQYAFGQVAMQIHAPFIPMVEEEPEEQARVEVGPKTFWVNTAQGYFWVEVRYVDGAPSVILTSFEAMVGDEFVYPGMALAAPGMISGCFDDSPETRYVLAQNGGVLTGVDEEKGTIKSTAIIDNASRITVVQNSGESHDFVIIQNVFGQSAEIRRLSILMSEGEFVIDRKYASIDMAYEGESNIYVTNLLPNPTWIHRKCFGSYFSPNKTIGYHVDIGTDDGFLGNLQSVYGADLLDNTGGFDESLFNHTADLYRLAGLLAFPVSISGETINFLLVAPTMGFTDDAADSKKCWGGYGLTQSWAGCVDYQQDTNSWLLSPRLVVVSVNLSTGEKTFADPALSSIYAETADILSWDGKFGGSVVYEGEYSCDTDFYSDMTTKEADSQCSWTESCTWTCDTNDPGSTGECPKGWTPYSHWEYFSRENLRNSKRMYFLFGKDTPLPQAPQNMNGFYFLFDGMWHLDIGVFWTTSRIEGDYCGLCMYPYGSQDPGENVVFSLQGADVSQVQTTGHEFVENMEIVTPLGWVSWPLGGTTFGFVAKVPEEYEAPHDPVMMIGGIEYQSGDVDGEVVRCQRALMSSPCVCAGNELYLDEYSAFELGATGTVQILDGCEPFEWSAQNAKFNGKSYEMTTQRTFSVVVDDDCSASISVKDACGTTVSMSAAYSVAGTVSGPAVLEQGESDTFTHNLEDAVYTGTLTLIEQSGNSAVLEMPESASYGSTYTASWEGKCGTVATMNVSTLPECTQPYDAVLLSYWGTGLGTAPRWRGARVLVIDSYRNHVRTVNAIDAVPNNYLAYCVGKEAGAWSIGFISGSGYVFAECTKPDGTGYWHFANGTVRNC